MAITCERDRISVKRYRAGAQQERIAIDVAMGLRPVVDLSIERAQTLRDLLDAALCGPDAVLVAPPEGGRG